LQKVELNEDETALLDLLFEDMQISPTSVGRLFTLLGSIMPRLELAAVDPRQRLYEKAKQYISECSVLRVPELARFLAMSESGVYAFFRSFGKTPIEVKNEILTERAVTLLSSTDMSVEQICGRVGFSSVAYFRKTVRRISGKTPTEIRRESRKNSSV
jgi:AraC-like DNA-binding protein